MAALVKHVLSKVFVPMVTQCRYKFRTNLARKKFWINPIKPGKRVESVITGMAARGFLRQLKDYDPPADVVERCDNICTRLLGPDTRDSSTLSEPHTRFNVLNECFKNFNHSVPNSVLYTISTVGDLKNFYLTPVSTTTPMEKLKTMDLPENLHVQYEPIRFHPETDTLFGGQTAFPKSNTLVTGLRTRKKYRGHIQPDNYCKE